MNELIAEVHAEDVQKAQGFLREAIAQASDAWLPSDTVMDALTLELIDLAGRHGSPAQVAAHLMKVAALLRQAQARSH